METLLPDTGYSNLRMDPRMTEVLFTDALSANRRSCSKELFHAIEPPSRSSEQKKDSPSAIDPPAFPKTTQTACDGSGLISSLAQS